MISLIASTIISADSPPWKRGWPLITVKGSLTRLNIPDISGYFSNSGVMTSTNTRSTTSPKLSFKDIPSSSASSFIVLEDPQPAGSGAGPQPPLQEEAGALMPNIATLIGWSAMLNLLKVQFFFQCIPIFILSQLWPKSLTWKMGLMQFRLRL